MKIYLMLLILVIIILPAFVFAEYTVYLKNGSTLENVTDYMDDGRSITIYFKMGSMVLDKGSILKIEGFSDETIKSTEGAVLSQETVKEEETRREEAKEPMENKKKEELEKLRAEVDSLNSEIRTTEEKEIELVTKINEKMAKRYNYNVYQLKRLEAELEPYRQELYSVQKKKQELIQKRNSIENILKEQR